MGPEIVPCSRIRKRRDSWVESSGTRVPESPSSSVANTIEVRKEESKLRVSHDMSQQRPRKCSEKKKKKHLPKSN